jgi:hypothetical protein
MAVGVGHKRQEVDLIGAPVQYNYCILRISITYVKFIDFYVGHPYGRAKLDKKTHCSHIAYEIRK